MSFLDEYSRYIVHHEVLLGMDGSPVSLAAQAAIDTLPKGVDGRPAVKPVIRSDNGSGYISREFAVVLKENGLGHHRIKPHCPEENGVMERAYRTLRESLGGRRADEPLQAQDVLERIVTWYNKERLHSALGYLRPVGLLPRRSRDPARGAAPQTGRGPTPTARRESENAATNDSVPDRGPRLKLIEPMCAKGCETIHRSQRTLSTTSTERRPQ